MNYVLVLILLFCAVRSVIEIYNPHPVKKQLAEKISTKTALCKIKIVINAV